MLGWIKHKLESRLPGEISITSDMHSADIFRTPMLCWPGGTGQIGLGPFPRKASGSSHHTLELKGWVEASLRGSRDPILPAKGRGLLRERPLR